MDIQNLSERDIITKFIIPSIESAGWNKQSQIREHNYWAKYGEAARKVLENLLEKYAESGIENIKDLSVLKVDPLNTLGTPAEIVRIFGSKEKYLEALRELEEQIYMAA